jgi:hypothetical protein
MITRIEAYKYRCFDKLDVSFEGFQVMVGSNGSGKTTLLDIPALLSDMLRTRRVDAPFFEKISTQTRTRAELASDLIFNHRGEYFGIVIEAKLPEGITSSLVEELSSRSVAKAKQFSEKSDTWPEVLRYELQCEKFNEDIQVSQEHLLIFPKATKRRPPHGAGLIGESADPLGRHCISVLRRHRGEPATFYPEARTKRARFRFSFEPAELALSNVPSDQDKFASALWFRRFLTQGTCSYQPRLEAMRSASSPRGRIDYLASDGSTLPWLIKNLKERKNKHAFQRWLRLVRLALPPVKDIVPVVREDDRAAYFKVIYASGHAIPSSSISDGTLNILALTILPYLDSLPGLLTIEEPENGVHPRAIQAITDALASVGSAQVLLSSHSPIVLANVKRESVLCLRQNSAGASEAIPGLLHPGLAKWKGSLDLGTLFAAGVLS